LQVDGVLDSFYSGRFEIWNFLGGEGEGYVERAVLYNDR
jgi:hypothetical protein